MICCQKLVGFRQPTSRKKLAAGRQAPSPLLAQLSYRQPPEKIEKNPAWHKASAKPTRGARTKDTDWPEPTPPFGTES